MTEAPKQSRLYRLAGAYLRRAGEAVDDAVPFVAWTGLLIAISVWLLIRWHTTLPNVLLCCIALSGILSAIAVVKRRFITGAAGILAAIAAICATVMYVAPTSFTQIVLISPVIAARHVPSHGPSSCRPSATVPGSFPPAAAGI